MPIYKYECECGHEEEVIQRIGTRELRCLKCGAAMAKRPTSFAFVFMKGKGGYPSFRKRYLGTAPGTSRVTGHEGRGGTGSSLPIAKMKGDEWLETIE